jgi:hypothetical protein
MKHGTRITTAGMLLTLAISLTLIGCGQRYITPGRGAKLMKLSQKSQYLTDSQMVDEDQLLPMARFPTHMAIIRVQESGYRSYSGEGYGEGNFSVVTTRDVEKDEHFDRLRRMVMVSGLAPMNRLLLPYHLQSDEDLRYAASRLKADILIIYTFDTNFRIEDKEIGPLGIITLGTLPNQQAKVTTTASAAFFDVRTGFVYGLADATASESRMASIWVSDKAVEESRIAAERKSFEMLLEEIQKAWKNIVEEYAVAR